MSVVDASCPCRVCVFARRVETAMDSSDVVALRRVVTELAEMLYIVEEERNWAYAVIDGSRQDANSVIARARRACSRELPVAEDADLRPGTAH